MKTKIKITGAEHSVVLACSLFIGGSAVSFSAQSNEKAQDSEERIEVSGRATLIGEAVSASQGVLGKEELVNRPMLRTGEILELVPGMVVTQHSGTGKANQYFLRGFNLDHGTDFATSIDGMPINMRSHGHGQGYTDLNFIIPEVVQTLSFKKGAYYAQVGDFSGAGSAAFSTVDKLQSTQLSATLGQDNFQRYLVAGGANLEQAHINYAVEYNSYDGPWTDINEDLDKTNLWLSYNQAFYGGNFKLSLMAYDNTWNSADQIPSRAVSSGLISELGSLDTSLGGDSSRYSVNASWQSNSVSVSAYLIDYDLNLWSNFTYFLDDADNGDQFKQVDKRQIYGGEASYVLFSKWAGLPATNEFGVQYRADDIDDVGLFKTQNRQVLGSIRNDAVTEKSTGLYWQNTLVWNEAIRTVVSARYDYYDFDVASKINVNVNNIDLSQNKGREHDDNIALKGNLIYTFNSAWEAYVSAGQGFHSNDARGTITQVDPGSGELIQAVDPIVDSFGYEIGVRASLNDSLNASLSLWTLQLDSELLFVGDAGNTEASDSSERTGVEFTAYYRLNEALSFDVEYAYTDAKFDDLPSDANHIPGALEHVLQTGIKYQADNGWFASARLRYLSERPLVEDASEESSSTKIVNVNVGYNFDQVTLKLDILNALDSNDHDIDYFYESRLANEAIGSATSDLHYHVFEPRTVRLTATYQF